MDDEELLAKGWRTFTGKLWTPPWHGYNEGSLFYRYDAVAIERYARAAREEGRREARVCEVCPECVDAMRALAEKEKADAEA